VEKKNNGFIDDEEEELEREVSNDDFNKKFNARLDDLEKKKIDSIIKNILNISH